MERIIVELNNSNIFDRILYLENEEQIVLTTFPEINNHSHRCNHHFLFLFFPFSRPKETWNIVLRSFSHTTNNHNSPPRSGNPLDPLEPSWKSRPIDDTLRARWNRGDPEGEEVAIKRRKSRRVSQYWSKGGGVQCPRARHRVCDRALPPLFLSLSLSRALYLVSTWCCLARRDIHRREGSSELTSYSWFPIKDDRRRKKREGGKEGREKVLFLTREIGERSASFNPSVSLSFYLFLCYSHSLGLDRAAIIRWRIVDGKSGAILEYIYRSRTNDERSRVSLLARRDLILNEMGGGWKRVGSVFWQTYICIRSVGYLALRNANRIWWIRWTHFWHDTGDISLASRFEVKMEWWR